MAMSKAKDLCDKTAYVVFADVLYWTARESGADNWAMNFSTDPTQQTIDVLAVPFEWSFGFRCGVDYCLRHDGWDTKGIFTRFSTQGKDRATSSSGLASPFLGNFYINNADGTSVETDPQYRGAQVKWTILLDIFDWELGQKYWVSSALALRPFMGLKGGWIHQTIHTRWFHPINVTSETTFLEGTEDLKNNFGGLGPSVGMDLMWKLGSVRQNIFSLVADFSGAILWGRWAFKDVYQNDQPQKVSVETSKLSSATSTLRGFLGFEWKAGCIANRFSFCAKVGFESQFWLNQLQFYSYNTGRLSNPLTLQGATLDLFFSF